MRQSVVGLMGGVFALLMIGMIFSSSNGQFFPVSRQLSNPEASAIDLTKDQAAMLAVLTVVVLGAIGTFTVGLGLTVLLLNRQVATVQQQPAQPVELLASGGDFTSARNAIVNNAMLLVIIAGAAMLAITLLVLLLL